MGALGIQFEGAHRTLLSRFRGSARQLYSGRSVNCRLFFYALLVFDLTSPLFIIATSFLPRNDLVRGLDITFGIAFLIELVFRLSGSRRVDRSKLSIPNEVERCSDRQQVSWLRYPGDLGRHAA